jgi:hypothetical protein
MSSVPTLESSTTHPICNLFIPKAMGTILTSLFQTSPSMLISLKIFSESAFKSYSVSKTLTSKTMIDLAMTTFFSFFFSYSAFCFSATLARVALSSSLSSPKRSMSSSSFFFSTFFSSFFSYLASPLNP